MTSQSDHLRLRARGRSFSKGENHDEDSSIKAKEAEEREAHINYTLDMVVHDLVSQGHLHPAKSYLLKTPEMRDHIGKMCDKLNQRKHEDQGGTAPTFARKNVPKSKRASKNPTNTASDKSQNLTKEFILPKKEKPVIKHKDGLKPVSTSLANIPGSANISHPKPEQSKTVEPWITPRDIVDDKKRRPMISKPDNRNATSSKNKGKKVPPKVPLSDPSTTNELSAQAFRAKVDISGFENDEITLDLEGRRLVIVGQRAKKGEQNARKLTEVIEIPEGVNLENLKMGRRLDGSLLIEEFVPGLD
ncbi:unnamed protein product [Allacma fusca]|uniref:SHSP domain-containing protein n=1 Tax=Allacma fusca TaxID=39272 RepID=A0A8J2K6V2_9HEXA|nr:unnamed protein product [Allacma fusca]